MSGENMTFFISEPDKQKMVIASLESKRMLLSRDDFNSLADYLLFKKYFKKVKIVTERENYIIGEFTFKIPVRRWNERNTTLREIRRFIIIGFDENNKIVCFYSDNPIEIPFSFGFAEDISRFEEIELSDFGYERRYRVQGDVVLEVRRVQNVFNDYLNSLFLSSSPVIHNILINEIYRRISDILAEIGITTTLIGENLAVEGWPRNLKREKFMEYIIKNLVLSDIFQDYTIRTEVNPISDTWYLRFISNTSDNIFVMRMSTWIERMDERLFQIRINFETTMMTRETPEWILFMNIVRDTELLKNVNEQEFEERIGRHSIHIENALPRHLAVEYEFPLTQRHYGIVLNSVEYVTSGTKIKLEHPQHGNKIIKIPASRFRFLHVNDLYRTTAIKNNLLLHYYFT